MLPVVSVRTALGALQTDDRELKGTALEYLETVTPLDTQRLFASASSSIVPLATGMSYFLKSRRALIELIRRGGPNRYSCN